MMKKTSVIYARVSTKRQAEDGLPIDSQLDRCRARADAAGAVVERVFVDGGISGRIESRPEFQAAIDYCERNGVDYFITWSTSRFARDKHTAATYKRRLDRAGTRLVYVSVDIDRDSDAGYLTESFMEVMDEYYSRQISKDTRRSMIRNAEQGYWNGGRVPFGYRVVRATDNPKRRRLEIDPIESDVVRRIFRMRLDGSGAKTIAIHLNSVGSINRDRPWTKHAIMALLHNDIMRGCMVYGRRDRPSRKIKPRGEWVIVKSHDPIITSSDFEKVQELMAGVTNSPDHGSPLSNHVFTGLLRCGACGGSMQIQTATGGNGKRYSYYNCRSAMVNGSCENRRIPADELDSWLIESITGRLFTKENLSRIFADLCDAVNAWSSHQDEIVSGLRREISSLSTKNEKMMRILEGLDDGTDPGLILRAMNQRQSQIDALNVRLAQEEAKPPPKLDISADDFDQLSSFMLSIMLSSENTRKTRAFFASVLEKIIIEDQQARICYRPDLLVSRSSANPFAAEVCWLPEPALLRTRDVLVDLPVRWRRAA